MAELLLANKADVNVKSKEGPGSSPLHFAALKGRKEMAELLLANNADVNAKTSGGETPLHMAGVGGHKGVADLLRQHGGHE